MKKYNKPEIVTLALDVIDVIETSAEFDAATELEAAGVNANNIVKMNQQIKDMNDTWSW